MIRILFFCSYWKIVNIPILLFRDLQFFRGVSHILLLRVYWTPAFRQRGPMTLALSVGQYLSRSVIVLLKNRSWDFFDEAEFFEKNLILGIMPKNTPKMVFFRFYEKFSSLVYVIFGFKWCTIIVFEILQKPHAWEKSGSWVISKNALDQSDC